MVPEIVALQSLACLVVLQGLDHEIVHSFYSQISVRKKNAAPRAERKPAWWVEKLAQHDAGASETREPPRTCGRPTAMRNDQERSSQQKTLRRPCTESQDLPCRPLSRSEMILYKDVVTRKMEGAVAVCGAS